MISYLMFSLLSASEVIRGSLDGLELLEWRGEGLCLIIENVENEVDPMLDPVLDKQIIKKGRLATIKM